MVARMPYFSYLSMLHLYETLGWWCVLPLFVSDCNGLTQVRPPFPTRVRTPILPLTDMHACIPHRHAGQVAHAW